MARGEQDLERLIDDDSRTAIVDIVAENNELENDAVDVQPIVYTSQLAALLITINVTIGAGILAMPAMMNQAGIIPSLIIQIPFLIGVIVTTIMCTELTVKSRVNSYHNLVKAHCHPIFYHITQLTLRLIVFGTVAAFMVIIGDQSDSFMFAMSPEKFCEKHWYMNSDYYMILATVLLIIPLCSAKTVDFLKYASFLGVMSIGFIVFMVSKQCLKQYQMPHSNDKGWWADGVNWWGEKNQISFKSFFILPVFCLAYQCHLSLVPTAATTRKEEKYTTYKTITVAMLICCFIYSAVSVMAILASGSKIQKDLTASFKGDWVVDVTIAIVALKCIFTLPPAFLPARMSIIEDLNSRCSKFANLSEPLQRYGVTTIVMLSALTLALFNRKIQSVVEILGCLSVLFIFPLPALSYLSLVDQNRKMKQQIDGDNSEELKYTFKDKVKRNLSFFYIIFGLLMMLLVLYTSISDIINSKEDAGLCPKNKDSSSSLTLGEGYRRIIHHGKLL